MKKFASLLAFALFAVSAPRADAALVINIYNSGPDVISSMSGTINNLPAGTFHDGDGGNAIFSSFQIVGWAPLDETAGYTEYNLLTAPTFGNGGFFFADSGISGNANLFFTDAFLFVGLGYVEGSSISATATYSGTSIAAMGLNAGTYYYTWGNGVTTDAATLIIGDNPPGPAAVPEPGTWAAAALLAGGAGFMRWRKRAKVS